jgi:hypothetical protein
VNLRHGLIEQFLELRGLFEMNKPVSLWGLLQNMSKLEDDCFHYECGGTGEYSDVSKTKNIVESMVERIPKDGYINDIGDMWGVNIRGK